MNALRKPARWLGTAVALLALLVGSGAATVAAPASPAYASAGYIELCLPVFDQYGNIIGWHDCIVIPLPVEKPKPGPCDHCPWTFGMEHLVLPSDPWYLDDVLSGLDLLSQAAAADPREAAQLRAAALEAFLAAAERLGEGQVRLGDVGIANFERNVIEPVPEPWLEAAGTDVGNGLSLLQRALTNPDPQPWLAAGMAEFEEAYQEIIEQQPVGR